MIHSDPAYINGLRQGDPIMLETIYLQFRHHIVQTIQAHGGTVGDGSVFFRTAITEAARSSQDDPLPDGLTFGDYLKGLAVAHYRDWLLESDKALPPSLDEYQMPDGMPDSTHLRETRHMILAHRLWDQSDPECKQRISTAASETSIDALEELDPCITNYLNGIQSADSAPYVVLPDFAKSAIRDLSFYGIRQQTKDLEIRLAKGSLKEKIPPPPPNPLFRNLFIGMILISLGIYAYQWLNKPKDVKEVFTNNFDAPKSLVADAQSRLGKNVPTEGDSIGYEARPIRCDQILAEADVYYQKGDYKEAAGIMYELTDNPDLSPCHSDAYFYLGILALHLDAPSITLQSFAKIEDLERFGEDIYWFQALAYVKMASDDVSMREIALRAIQRAHDNTVIENRRVQAEKMMAELGSAE